MSQNQNDERPQDAVEPTDETPQPDATPETGETQVLDATPETGETQVLESADAGPGDTQVLDADGTGTPMLEPAPAGPDEPLSVFDQPAPTQEPTATPYGGYSDSGYGSTGYTAASYGAPEAPAYQGAGYATGYQTPPPAYTTPAASYPTAPYEPLAWMPPPAPLVKTTPRTSTIVWGFIILAVGIGAVSVAAGATLDVGLAMIWLLAAAGAVLVVASIIGASRRRGRPETTAGA